MILSLFCNVGNHNSGSESSLKIQIIFILFSNTNFKHDAHKGDMSEEKSIFISHIYDIH